MTHLSCKQLKLDQSFLAERGPQGGKVGFLCGTTLFQLILFVCPVEAVCNQQGLHDFQPNGTSQLQTEA